MATTKQRLIELGQGHLFEGQSEAQTQALMDEINSLSYGGGIERYILQGRKLLGTSTAPTSAEEGAADSATVSRVDLPDSKLLVNVENLSDATNKELLEAVAGGLKAMHDNVFVMVAGGLGERLGYSSIKLGLPVETATGMSYIELYLRWAAACGRNPNWTAENNKGPRQNPFLIMTSDDTHKLTQEHLAKHKYFGYDPSSVILMKQDTVPCLMDNTAKVALGPNGTLLRKPHGHGDVHQLIFGLKSQSSPDKLLIDELVAGPKGETPYKSITFMQDTNGAATSTAPVSVYYLLKNEWAMAFTSVPRMPGEAIGIYCAQTMGNGKQRCGNIEYNLFSPIYTKATGKSEEPLIEGTRYSVFPGSINTLIMSLDAYVAALKKDKGHVPEFINPKFADSTKTTFKSPARIESLMQDIAFCFDFPKQKIGCTTFNRDSFEPVKNALADGIASHADKGIAAACAASGEEAWLRMNRTRVAAAGVHVHTDNAPKTVIVSPADSTKKLSVTLFPIIAHDPTFVNFAVTDAIQRFPSPSRVSISARSSLVVKGNVTIKSLVLDGALVIDASKAPKDTTVVVEDLRVTNEGWAAVPLAELDNSVQLTEVDRIRGYVIIKKKTAAYVFDGLGDFVINNSTTASSL